MGEWSFEHSIVTHARRTDAWAYWSDLRNHARMEPGVERIELDGPFATGTKGRTIGAGYSQDWTLTEVVEGSRFVITGYTPDGAGALSFAWDFRDEDGGPRMTQKINARGPGVEEYMEAFRQMEYAAPRAMERLVAELDGLRQEGHHGE